MVFDMKLWPDSFEAIQAGTKTVEMRLNDEKRQKIQIGDILQFTNTLTQEVTCCVVLDKRVFPSFKELYEVYDKISIGYKESEEAKPEDMYAYYPKEDIEAYGALAIQVCSLSLLTPKLLVDSGICPTCFDRKYGNCLYGDMTDKLIYQDEKIVCFFAGNPRAVGHTIISSIVHYKDMLTAPKDLVIDIYSFAQRLMQGIQKIFQCESVYLCTMCDGPMNHFHIQLIPRYKDELRGSRNFVKERGTYVLDKEKLSLLQAYAIEENL